MASPAEAYFDGNPLPQPPHVTLSALGEDNTVVSERFPMRAAPQGIVRISTLALREFLDQLPPTQLNDSIYIQFDAEAGMAVPNEFDALLLNQEPVPTNASFYLDSKVLEVQPFARIALLESVQLGLEPLEFDLLSLLSRHPDEVLPYEQIIKTIWSGQEPSVSPLGSLTSLARRTRRKLGPKYGHSRKGIIQNIRAVGYRGAVAIVDQDEDNA